MSFAFFFFFGWLSFLLLLGFVLVFFFPSPYFFLLTETFTLILAFNPMSGNVLFPLAVLVLLEHLGKCLKVVTKEVVENCIKGN